MSPFWGRHEEAAELSNADDEWLQPDEKPLREWMFGFLIDHTGEDCTYHNMLERSMSRYGEFTPLNGPELDRAEIFKELVTSLTDLLGSEDAAGQWLMHSAVFREFGGTSPIHYLEEGGFWTLSLLADVIKIAKAHPTDPMGLRAESKRPTSDHETADAV